MSQVFFSLTSRRENTICAIIVSSLRSIKTSQRNLSMSDAGRTNRFTLRNYGFTVSPRGQRTPGAVGADGLGSASRAEPVSTDDELRDQLESVVQQYRDTQVTKWQACSQLVGRIESHSGIEDTAKEAALAMYLAEVDSAESILKQTNEHAARIARGEDFAAQRRDVARSDERAASVNGGLSTFGRAGVVEPPPGGKRCHHWA
ncbi:hypothetical protein HYPSUDRAFT_206842 [Hypholoma sublateritium FD-334 SS-4]|uniref:Uncharacterized protein n=1 Tax=Hypholoma sublateritium (strain FD-334 SS-4) TaxID=945553 RepID=A0A0D2NC00_HYPSF|nr:hypothetical protein HYPSUDRAFT_206842 [Hypholoma sublateritium FD-334 SS-4]